MPIWKKWSKFTKENILKLPIERGAYELADKNKNKIDGGGSDSERSGVRGRLLSRLRLNNNPDARYFRVISAPLVRSGIGMEATLNKRHVKRYGEKPKDTKRVPHKYDIS